MRLGVTEAGKKPPYGILLLGFGDPLRGSLPKRPKAVIVKSKTCSIKVLLQREDHTSLPGLKNSSLGIFSSLLFSSSVAQ